MLTKATDLSVTLEDRPGKLAKVMDAIAAAKANIDGLCGSADSGNVFHFLFIKDADKARRAIESAGVKVKGEREVVVVDVEDRPGSGAERFRKLAQQELNIDLAYLATSNRLVIGGESPQRIWEVLGKETAAKITA
ncbi:MAG: amino acid-binding protein [Chloroflexota bacterium]|nr:amino acid-binding protein [Chloroflexota bacterium]